MEAKAIRLDVITPVHIGTGDFLDPMGYLIKDGDGGPCLHLIDIAGWVEDHPDPEALADLFAKSPLPALRRYLYEHLDPAVYGISRARVLSTEVSGEYQAKLGDQRSENQLQLSPGLRSGMKQTLVIPGSSVKGAIRTAVIDFLDREFRLNLKGAAQPREYREKLEGALGRIREDAFKHLKVGDFEAARDSSLIVTAKETSRKPEKQGTPKPPCEVVASRCLGEADHSRLYGRVRIGAAVGDGANNRLTIAQGQIRAGWNWDELAHLVSNFYLERYRRERENFYRQAHFHRTAEALARVEADLLEPRPGEMVLRVGHYSHVECMTVTANAPRTRKTKDGKIMPFGTTRTLANGIFPFGWVKLVPCGEEEFRQGIRAKEEHDAAAERQRLELRRTVLEQREAQLREKQERHQQELKKRESEARRKAELEAMPAEERQLFLLEKGELSDNEVFDLFGQLDSLEAGLKQRAANAIKGLWQTQGRWSKKECSKKQWEKVEKLKAILGE